MRRHRVRCPALILGGTFAWSLYGEALRADTETPIVTSEDAFFASVRDHEFTMEDAQPLASQWAEQMQPVINAGDLASLIESQRAGMSAIHTVVRVRHEAMSEESMSWTIRSEFAARYDELFHAVEVLEGDAEMGNITRATDGDIERLVDRLDDGRGAGTVRYRAGQRGYFKTWDPLLLQMLTDTPRAFGMTLGPYDLVTFLRASAIVLDDLVEIDDSTCIMAVVGLPARHRVFLDIDRDFAVVQFDEFQYEHDNAGRPIRRSLVYVRRAHNLRSYGNGLWLPSMITVDEYDESGEVTTKWTHDVLEVMVGDAVGEHLFSDLFSQGMFVNDQTRYVSYYHGVDQTVEDALVGEIARTTSGRTRPPGTGSRVSWNVLGDVAGTTVFVAVIGTLAWIRHRHGRVA